MKLVVAPASFKGSMSALTAAAAMAAGIRKALPGVQVVSVPVADGGEGTMDALLATCGGEKQFLTALGPGGRPMEAAWGLLRDGSAVVEVAAASGFSLASPDDGGPLRRTTYGTGQLVRAALEAGVKRLILALGGSATVDGGSGLLTALGYRFLAEDGSPLAPGGGALGKLARVDSLERHPLLAGVQFTLACDVAAPLLGERGAARLFGPQKGAEQREVEILEAGLGRLAQVAQEATGIDGASLPGGGAAGGMGAILAVFLGAKIVSGAELVLEASGFAAKVADAAAIFTGEGRVDAGTMEGKGPLAVLRAAPGKCPVYLLAGEIGPGAEALYDFGVAGMMTIVPGPVAREDALSRGEEFLEMASFRLARILGSWDGERL